MFFVEYCSTMNAMDNPQTVVKQSSALMQKLFSPENKLKTIIGITFLVLLFICCSCCSLIVLATPSNKNNRYNSTEPQPLANTKDVLGVTDSPTATTIIEQAPTATPTLLSTPIATPTPTLAPTATPEPTTAPIIQTPNPTQTPKVTQSPQIIPPSNSNTNGYSCSPKKTCGQMRNCDEAKYHLNVCGNKDLDRDNDGSPCETLCGSNN
jgi:hypothetical protein